MKMNREYYDDKGNHILETDDGYIFINGSCVAEPCTDEQCDKYAVEVMNGDGYYNSEGRFVRFRDE